MTAQARHGRSQILDAIRNALDQGSPKKTSTSPGHSVVPERAALDAAGRQALFTEMAVQAAATVRHLSSAAEIPSAVMDFLAERNLPVQGVVAPDMGELSWRQAELDIRCGKGEDGDAFSLTGAFAGIAETGTLMLLSGPGSPTTLNFLPEAHIVVLKTGDIVGAYEHAWSRLGAQGIAMPRAINFITGPSRTADIEQTMQCGAHGPRHLHILLIDEHH